MTLISLLAKPFYDFEISERNSIESVPLHIWKLRLIVCVKIFTKSVGIN